MTMEKKLLSVTFATVLFPFILRIRKEKLIITFFFNNEQILCNTTHAYSIIISKKLVLVY